MVISPPIAITSMLGPSFSTPLISQMGAPQSWEPNLMQIWLLQNSLSVNPSPLWCKPSKHSMVGETTSQPRSATLVPWETVSAWSEKSSRNGQRVGQRFLRAKVFSALTSELAFILCVRQVLGSNRWLLGVLLTSCILPVAVDADSQAQNMLRKKRKGNKIHHH